jgi:hypothetical protein
MFINHIVHLPKPFCLPAASAAFAAGTASHDMLDKGKFLNTKLRCFTKLFFEFLHYWMAAAQ